MNIDYSFKQKDLLTLAMTHRSYGNEVQGHKTVDEKDNERFELLGDALLEFIITEMLLKTHPGTNEGTLSKMRASLVNEKTLALVARSLQLGPHLLLGKGEEQTGGREKDSILSSCLEALVAAIYVDSNFETSQRWVSSLFKTAVEDTKHREIFIDYKTKLQELIQAKFKIGPKYNTIESSGPDHDKTFIVELVLKNQTLSKGTGKSKKEAEQDAARIVYENLQLLEQKNLL